MNSDGLNNQGTIKNPLAVMQDGEKIIFEVRRHPIGLLYMYAGVGAVLIFFAIIAFVVCQIHQAPDLIRALLSAAYYSFLLPYLPWLLRL